MSVGGGGGRPRRGFVVKRSAIANEGTQYGNNGGLVAGRVLHEALKRINTTESNIDRGGAEIGDSGVVAIGDLSLCSDLKLLLGCQHGQGSKDEGCDGCEAGQPCD